MNCRRSGYIQTRRRNKCSTQPLRCHNPCCAQQAIGLGTYGCVAQSGYVRQLNSIKTALKMSSFRHLTQVCWSASDTLMSLERKAECPLSADSGICKVANHGRSLTHDRPIAAIRAPLGLCIAASPNRPLVQRAAFERGKPVDPMKRAVVLPSWMGRSLG